MINRLTPQEIADKLRKCADGGGCDSCPYKCGEDIGEFGCICEIMHAAADAIDNQRTHIQALIKANDAHREMVAQAPKPPTNRVEMVEALDAIETGMTRLAMSRDIWQNDLVYTLCQGVRLLLEDRIKNRGAR